MKPYYGLVIVEYLQDWPLKSQILETFRSFDEIKGFLKAKSSYEIKFEKIDERSWHIKWLLPLGMVSSHDLFVFERNSQRDIDNLLGNREIAKLVHTENPDCYGKVS